MDYVYAIVGISMDVILLLVMAQIFVRKCPFWSIFIIYIIYGIVVLLLNVNHVQVIYKLPFCIFIIWLIFLYAYEKTEKGIKLGVAILYMIVITISELLVVITVMLIGPGSIDELTESKIRWFLCLTISKAFTYLIVETILKIYKNHNRVGKRFFKIAQCGPLIVTGALLILIAYMLLNIDDLTKEHIVLSMGAVTIVVFIYTLAYNLFYQMYYELSEKETEVQILKEKNDMQYKYYKSKLDIETEMRKIHHDLKNYMLILKLGNSNIEKLDKRITQLTDQFQSHVDTGNEMLNIIMLEKKEIAEQYRISLDASISFPDWCTLSDLEICTLFGNLLDNAIDAASQVSDIKRKITVKIKPVQENVLAINICNSIGETGFVKKRGGGFVSTKIQSGHGLGLKNVIEVVERHRGYIKLQPSEQEKIFTVSIIFYKQYM